MSADNIRAALAFLDAGEPTKAANLGDLADFDIESPPVWRRAIARIWDEWRECIFNGGGGFPEGGIRALYRDAAAVAKELDRRDAAGSDLAGLRRMLTAARFLVGHQGTPTHVMRDLAGMGIKADERAERAEAEVERLDAWLAKIEGGDSPCTDEAQLRRWAYEGGSLAHPVPA